LHAAAGHCARGPDGRQGRLAFADDRLDLAAMADRDAETFQPRLGRIRDRRVRVRSFAGQVERAVRKAGGEPSRIGQARPAKRRTANSRFNARGRGAKVMAMLGRAGPGRANGDSQSRARRVVVKARVVRFRSGRGPRGRRAQLMGRGAALAHLAYLQREGAGRDGASGRAYSASQDEADGRAFVERSEQDRHQFRFIVSPEDAVELQDIRALTRALMRRMERDLETGLDWIAVDHHNTGHPHTHILVRGVTDEGKVLNIAGDYIAYGVRHRASELVTLELGPQTLQELTAKLAHEVSAERLTRLDQTLIDQQTRAGLVDLRPGQDPSIQVRQNRALLLGRMRTLERLGLATETGVGQWRLADGLKQTLDDLGAYNDSLETIHRALAARGLAQARWPGQYVVEPGSVGQDIVGRVLDKGLAGDGLGDKVYLIVDGLDGRVHHLTTSASTEFERARPGHVLEVSPRAPEPRASDRNIVEAAGESGVYRPSAHLDRARRAIERRGGDTEAFVGSHVRRLEALRRAGLVERIDADQWRVPADLAQRGLAYDQAKGEGGLNLRTLSTLDLEQQIESDGATWLDRQLAAGPGLGVIAQGFGQELAEALDRRAQRLLDRGLVQRGQDGRPRLPVGLLDRLEAAEVARVGEALAARRGLAFRPVGPGDAFSGKLLGAANLASGRYAMMEVMGDAGQLGFALVPWRPVLEPRIGQRLSGLVRDDGAVDWRFTRQRGIEL
jgi:type IV secretory pathway VirD2 relaxase